MKTSKELCVVIAVLAASVFLTSCNPSNASQTPPPPVYYGIGGTVVNLAAGDSVQLQDNGSDTLTVTANGSFTFATKLTSGSAYKVTVSTQPSSPAQTCGVTNGTGTATGNVTNVAVDCGHNEWTWMGGSSTMGAAGTYGAGPGTNGTPGARARALAWVDASGNFWMFGGIGRDSTNTNGWLNDLWKYSGGQWTWMSGSNVVNQGGTYGNQGTAAADNVPGARWGAVSWTDTNGNFWLFGGYGFDSNATQGFLNDLWEYSAGEWTWMSGSSTVNQEATYGNATGTTGTPGARWTAVGWTDATGNLWLFGGQGYGSSSAVGELNDLWEYSGGQWTWMAGSDLLNQEGNYGASTGTTGTPGARYIATGWTDMSGNFWLFGGLGYDSTGGYGDLNDLWKYSGGQWTWVSGSNVQGKPGTYGTAGTAAPGNVPGARDSAFTWTDKSGNAWLFGGWAYDSTGTEGYINDLWKYSGGQWTWISGSNVQGKPGTYGTAGTAAPGNVPGARCDASTWIDQSGNLWLLGGIGNDSFGTQGPLNDLWRYEP